MRSFAVQLLHCVTDKIDERMQYLPWEKYCITMLDWNILNFAVEEGLWRII